MPRRHTDAELAAIIDSCRQMLAQGFYDGEIKRAVAAKFDLSPRTVERYLRRARDQLIAESGRTLVEHRSVSLALYQSVRRGTITVHGPTGPITQVATIAERMRANECIDRLMGLSAPTKLEHAGAGDGPIQVRGMTDEQLDKAIADRQRKIAALVGRIERLGGAGVGANGDGEAA